MLSLTAPFWKMGPQRLHLSKAKAYTENTGRSVFSFNYPLLYHLTPPRKEAKKKKKIMIRASQTTTAASFLVQVQLSTIKFTTGLDWQGIITSTTEKRGSCSQLTLPPPQRRVVQSLWMDPFLSTDWVLGRLGPNWFWPNPWIPSAKRVPGILKALNKCFSPPPQSGGPK